MSIGSDEAILRKLRTQSLRQALALVDVRVLDSFVGKGLRPLLLPSQRCARSTRPADRFGDAGFDGVEEGEDGIGAQMNHGPGLLIAVEANVARNGCGGRI